MKARTQSYVDPVTGSLDAPGLGNRAEPVEADQARRIREVHHQLERQPPPTQQQQRLDPLD